MGPAAAATAALALVERGQRAAVALVVEGPVPASVGGRLVLGSDGTVAGRLLGGEHLEEAALAKLRDALEAWPPREGLQTVRLPAGGELRLFVEVLAPGPELVIVGAGHIAQPLCRIGDLLGFRVLVLDDRPEFATRERFPEAYRVLGVDFADPFADVEIGTETHLVLVTRGHRYDFECLRRLVAVTPPPAYIGMIGSRRRIRATFAQLLDEGVQQDPLSKVRAPVGLDVGAQTPAEIAVAVGAELVQRRRGGTGVPLSSKERILERYFSS